MANCVVVPGPFTTDTFNSVLLDEDETMTTEEVEGAKRNVECLLQETFDSDERGVELRKQ